MSGDSVSVEKLEVIVGDTGSPDPTQPQPRTDLVDGGSKEGKNPNVVVIEKPEDQEGKLRREVQQVLEEQLSPEHLVIEVDVGCGGSAKLAIFIVSDKFEGLALLKRHRAVQQAIRSIPDYESRVHAITITKSLTPAQYQAQNQ